jgi:hypothetical protein
LIEGNKLIVNDFDTISELTTFVADKTSFKADDGHNDDLVMGLVMFAWATGQKYFKDIVNHDIRKQIQLENMNQLDEEVLPAPIIETGLERPYELIDGDLWESVDGSDIYSGLMRDALRNL